MGRQPESPTFNFDYSSDDSGEQDDIRSCGQQFPQFVERLYEVNFDKLSDIILD